MPRCTVGTAGPPEEPPLCAEEAMCGDGKAASGTDAWAEGVNEPVGTGERQRDKERPGDQLRGMDRTDAPGTHRSSSRTGSERGDAISAAATRSTRRASVPERHRPPTNQHPGPAGPQANRHPGHGAPPFSSKTGIEIQEALKELICRDELRKNDLRSSFLPSCSKKFGTA
ncbi:hypothetical protein TREES_T100014617 [Tupaia chinensis]|uniref:Uncharacterized protein n=1 Tax=Tupaia chinensis TaxID=246437 RepID=L9KY66_TUPCH|nr:hypothetical protein TREES_T100014617 [Tupaia chinensis]